MGHATAHTVFAELYFTTSGATIRVSRFIIGRFVVCRIEMVIVSFGSLLA
jgi:hypothetical protein